MPTHTDKENAPDYVLKANDHTKDGKKNLVEIGAAWINQGPYGEYLDCKLGGKYSENFWLMSDAEFAKESMKSGSEKKHEGEELDYPEDEDITPESLPF
jgi:hypothetical protein